MADNNETVESLVADSRMAFIQGKHDQALFLANKAIKLDENNADAYQCAGNAYMSKAEYDQAVKAYKAAVKCDKNNGDRYFNLGYAHAAANQQSDALAMFAKADEIGCSPNVTGQLYKIMAMVCFDMKRYEDAVINFIKAEKIIGIDMDILKRKAISYSMTGDTSTAIEVANQMKILAPTDYIGYRVAFEILLQEERFEEAEKEFDRAERFSKLKYELFFDWVVYRTSQYKIDGDKSHLEKALEKLHEGLCVLKPEVSEVIDSYINAAELYVQLENAEMALNCLRAAENPIYSYNEGFSIIDTPDLEKKAEGRPSEREISHAIEAVRRKYGDRRLEAMGKEMLRNTRFSTDDAEKYTTPLSDKENETKIDYHLDSSIKAQYSIDKLDQINRLYVSAYTLKKDNALIRTYAAKLANSQDLQNKCIGKYSLVKAMMDEKNDKAEEEYRLFMKFLRNESIKDPSNLSVHTFRIQCHIDLGEYDEAENLCNMLSDKLKAPLMEQIQKARGES